MTRLQSLSAHALMAAVVFAILDPAAAGAQAKRVVCIDGRGDAFLTAYEGYLRANPGPKPNDIQIGNTAAALTACLSKVVKGDNLFVIAHAAQIGTRKGGAFEWGGTTYTGFAPSSGGNGTGVPGEPPFRVPAGFPSLTQITARS